MKNLLNCKVIMLPTEKGKDSNLFYHCPLLSNYKKLAFMDQGKEHRKEMLECGINKPQHLYLVSDREIKEEDWVYCNLNKGKIYQCMNHAFNNPKWNNSKETKDSVYKIEATTDTLLVTSKKLITNKRRYFYLPQIPQSFIEAYVKSNGKIEEVQIETEEYYYPNDRVNGNKIVKIKTRSDNTIIIHQSKQICINCMQLTNKAHNLDINDNCIENKSYTREEVENLIALAWATCSATTYKEGESIQDDCESWIKTHLK